MRQKLSREEIQRKAVAVTPFRKTTIRYKRDRCLMVLNPLLVSKHFTIKDIRGPEGNREADIEPTLDFNAAAFADLAPDCLDDIVVE